MLSKGPLSKHYQISQILRRRILTGELRPGMKIPGEMHLCNEYRISRGTVRKAISTLIHEGLLRTEQGYGTFVVDQPWRSHLFMSLSQFNEEMIHQNQQPRTVVLGQKVISASEEIANRLQLRRNDPVIYIARLRLANEIPILYERRYLALKLCPNLVDEDLEGQSIHALLIHKYHIPLIKTIHIIEARGLTQEEATQLQAQPGAAAFYIDRLTYTLRQEGEQPAVWYQAIYRGDKYTFRVEHIMKNTLYSMQPDNIINMRGGGLND